MPWGQRTAVDHPLDGIIEKRRKICNKIRIGTVYKSESLAGKKYSGEPWGGKGELMKYAADFRQEARAALQGKWPLAILVGLVAAILGGATSGGPEFKINFTGGSLNANIQYAGQTIYSWGDGITPGLRAVLVGGRDRT